MFALDIAMKSIGLVTFDLTKTQKQKYIWKKCNTLNHKLLIDGGLILAVELPRELEKPISGSLSCHSIKIIIDKEKGSQEWKFVL
jgi:hypothetical protein